MTKIYDSRLKSSVTSLFLGLFSDRDLIWLLVKRELTVRYKRSFLGVAWSFITPVAFAIILFFVLSNVFKAKLPDGAGYGTFLMCGILLSNFLNQGGTATGFSFSSNASVITKIRTEPLLFPVVSILSNFVNYLIGILPLVGFMLVENKDIRPSLLLLPLIGMVAGILILSIGLFTAGMAARYHDIHGMMSVFYTILGYATPIIYPLSILSGKTRFIIMINPFTGILEMIRGAVIDSNYMPHANWIAYYLTVIGVLFLTSIVFIRKKFPEIIEAL